MTIRNNKLAAIAAILTTALTLASCDLESSSAHATLTRTRITAIISASDRPRTASSPTRPIKTTGTRTRVKTAATSPSSTLPCSLHTASTTWKNPSSRNDSTAAQWC